LCLAGHLELGVLHPSRHVLHDLRTYNNLQQNIKTSIIQNPLRTIRFIPKTDMRFLCRNSQGFYLYAGGVSSFTTQAMSWTGSFHTFIVHAPERVRNSPNLVENSIEYVLLTWLRHERAIAYSVTISHCSSECELTMQMCKLKSKPNMMVFAKRNTPEVVGRRLSIKCTKQNNWQQIAVVYSTGQDHSKRGPGRGFKTAHLGSRSPRLAPDLIRSYLLTHFKLDNETK